MMSSLRDLVACGLVKESGKDIYHSPLTIHHLYFPEGDSIFILCALNDYSHDKIQNRRTHQTTQSRIESSGHGTIRNEFRICGC